MLLFDASAKRIRVGVVVADLVQSVNIVMIVKLKVNRLKVVCPLAFYVSTFNGAKQFTLDMGKLLPGMNGRVAICAFEAGLMIGTIF